MARRRRRTVLVLILCAAATSHLLLALAAYAGGSGGLVYKKNSLYHRIFVYQNGPIVTLQFGTRHPMLVESQVDTSNPRRHMLEYTTLTFCGLLYKPEPERVLVLGLGGGVIPREMHHYFPELQIDVVDIDRDIPPIAERFFGFRKDDRLKVHVVDGRVFIKRQLARDPVPKYDLIILDAFNSDYIPFHLMTKEFLQEVQGVLSEDGVVVANVFYSNRLFDAELMTYLDVFGRCQTFFGAYSTNAMLIAPGPEAPTLTVQEAAERAATLQAKHSFAFDLRSAARRLLLNTRVDPRAKVLTDDQAPVNWLRTQETDRSPAASDVPPEPEEPRE